MYSVTVSAKWNTNFYFCFISRDLLYLPNYSFLFGIVFVLKQREQNVGRYQCDGEYFDALDGAKQRNYKTGK